MHNNIQAHFVAMADVDQDTQPQDPFSSESLESEGSGDLERIIVINTDDQETTPPELVTMLNLTKEMHEDSGYLLVWKIVNPNDPSVIIKLFITPEQVDELRARNRIPTTMVIPLVVLPGGIELDAGNVRIQLLVWSNYDYIYLDI